MFFASHESTGDNATSRCTRCSVGNVSGKRNASACVLSDIKSEVTLCCVVTDISATVPPIGRKLCVVIELHPGRVFSRFGGVIFRALQMRAQKRFFGPFLTCQIFSHLTASSSKTVIKS